MSFTEHLDGYFADFGENVVVGTSTATAIVDAPPGVALDLMAREISITMRSDVVVDIGAARGDAVTIRGVGFRVRTIEHDQTNGQGLTEIGVTKP